MTDNNVFVELRPQGDYAIRRPNSQRASGVEPTQAKAVAEARRPHPGGPVLEMGSLQHG